MLLPCGWKPVKIFPNTRRCPRPSMHRIWGHVPFTRPAVISIIECRRWWPRRRPTVSTIGWVRRGRIATPIIRWRRGLLVSFSFSQWRWRSPSIIVVFATTARGRGRRRILPEVPRRRRPPEFPRRCRCWVVVASISGLEASRRTRVISWWHTSRRRRMVITLDTVNQGRIERATRTAMLD